MAEYIYIQNYTKKGKLAISTSVFDQIITLVIEKIKGVKIKKNQDFLFLLHRPIHCEIKEGKVNADIDVIVSQESNVNSVCLKIQEEIAYAISSMTECIPFLVNVKVVGIE